MVLLIELFHKVCLNPNPKITHFVKKSGDIVVTGLVTSFYMTMNQMENRQFVIYSACCCVHGSFFFFTEDINEKLVLQNGNANASKRVSHLYLSVPLVATARSLLA